MKVLVINAGQEFAHSGGKYNQTVAEATLQVLSDIPTTEVAFTNIADGYTINDEVSKFKAADLIIYHTPIWWFQLPYAFKKYLDEVLTAGYKVLYNNDGRKAENPTINYGTGGLLQGKKYILTTSWNAPSTAFTLPNEFFDQKSVDEGPLFGFHKMNAFMGLAPLNSFHFHDVEKNANVGRDIAAWKRHLAGMFK